MNNTDTISLWCPCGVTAWDKVGQTAHVKIDNKLVCTKCGRGA